MTLEEKGNIIPPPILSKYPEMASIEIQQWENIISATHWEIHNNNKPNGADFYMKAHELGHIHLDGMLHVPSTKEISKALIQAKLAEKFIYAQNWVQFRIQNEATANHALWIFRLHYDRLCGTEDDQVLQRILDFKA